MPDPVLRAMSEDIQRLQHRVGVLEYALAAQAYLFLDMLAEAWGWESADLTARLRQLAEGADAMESLPQPGRSDGRLADRYEWSAEQAAPYPRHPA